MMKFKKCLLPVAMLASFTLAGCQSNADDHAADVYQTDQLNTKQETKTVNIISILPAKVAVDNSQNKRNAEASADKKRDQSYEDELRSLEIQKQKLALAKEEARVKRENEFIDQELKHKAAQTDVVQSEADANRNMTEGGRDLMKSVGKAEENKSDSWFN
ncbi:DUF5384 family protein [Escherichia coli]